MWRFTRILILIVITMLSTQYDCNGLESNKHHSNSEMDSSSSTFGQNCTPLAINEFPNDLFTQTERSHGAVAVHILISVYIFYAITLVCDEYFVPSIQCICDELSVPSDVAGATFMSIATSAPELFTNLVGTFITKGDIGIGAIVGSAVFNVLIVVACRRLAANSAVTLEWWPLTRDYTFYATTVILLILVIWDQRVYWYEALVLVSFYLIYVLAMYYNTKCKESAQKFVFGAENDGSTETIADNAQPRVELCTDRRRQRTETENSPLIGSEEVSSWESLVGLPIRLCLAISIPNCRKKRFQYLYPITFLMCIVWIGLLSYVITWMMTVIGYTLGIPDSVMGLTFVAAGASVPEAVSIFIVARQGLGSMGLSNSIGSNTFDILMCLGLPWLIRSAMLWNTKSNYIHVNSSGFGISTCLLLACLTLLYIILTLNRYVLDKKVAFTAVALYIVFITISSMMELNVFFPVNLPTCLT